MTLPPSLLPWKAERTHIVDAEGHAVTLMDGGFNRDFIIHAVNRSALWEEMLNLLIDLRELTLSESGARTRMTLRVDQTLAACKEKP